MIHLSNGVLEGSLNSAPARFQVNLSSNSALLVPRNSWTKYLGMAETSSVSRSIDLSGAVVDLDEVENVMISFSGTDLPLVVREASFPRDDVDAFLGFPVFRVRIAIFDDKNDRIFVLD